MSTVTILVQHHTLGPSHCNKLRKVIGSIPIGKEEIKLPVFTTDMIIYGENRKD